MGFSEVESTHAQENVHGISETKGLYNLIYYQITVNHIDYGSIYRKYVLDQLIFHLYIMIFTVVASFPPSLSMC